MVRTITFSILLFYVFFSNFASAQAGQDVRLKVAANKRFFEDKDGKPFFWLGETGWLLFGKLNREEAIQFLDNRQAKGFNVVQVMVLHNVSAVNVYGDTALVDKNVAKPVTTPGNSFEDKAQYDFWDHVDFIIDEAAKRGIFMGLVPVWGTNVKNGWVKKEDAVTYATFLAERYRDRPNIIWLNGGDIKGSDSINTWKAIGNTIKAKDPNHLQTFHPFGRTTSSEWFHNEAWLDFNMFQSGHRSYDLDTSLAEHRFGPDNYKFLHMDYNLSPTKPTLDGEPSYELIPYGLHDTTKPFWNANDVRRYGYWSVFAGAAGHTYGHNSVMQMHKPSDINKAYGSKKYWNEALDDSGAAQMIHLKNLMVSKPYFDRVPDQTLIAGKPGLKYDYIAATRGADYAFIYTYKSNNFKVKMGKIKGANVKASWYSPKDGSTQIIGEIKNKGKKLFDPPGEPAEGNDRVLILESL
ncbi:MAG: glycoside hydrolase family 140 protein [Bacteroidota bacterium]